MARFSTVVEVEADNEGLAKDKLNAVEGLTIVDDLDEVSADDEVIDEEPE